MASLMQARPSSCAAARFFHGSSNVMRARRSRCRVRGNAIRREPNQVNPHPPDGVRNFRALVKSARGGPSDKAPQILKGD